MVFSRHGNILRQTATQHKQTNHRIILIPFFNNRSEKAACWSTVQELVK
jgi:hypothetical protein